MISTTLSVVLILNILFAIAIIFLERKKPSATLAWLMLLLLIPNIGFIIYLLFGRNLSRKKIFEIRPEEADIINNALKNQKLDLQNNSLKFNDICVEDYKDMVYMHLNHSESIFTQNNNIEIFIDGNDKFESLINSIQNAKDHIHMVYFIIKNDSLGKKIVNELTKKAKQGVEIRFLYDAIGSHSLPKNFFKDLKEAGGEAVAFFPIVIPFLNLNINYRNHRKIAVIDGTEGFIGGFNIGDEYISLNKKMGYWRDTHIKITGDAVHMLQTRFLFDWRSAHNKNLEISPKYFPKINSNGNSGVQIISSGPDSEWEQIKYGYIKMINSAKESIYIQTPYFIPDESILHALKLASLSGVDVKIMIPNKPDHMFVYWASSSYASELLKTGAECYIYEKGFIHAKTIVVDGKVASVGTANMDVRSFKLNFEVNAFIYDSIISNEFKLIFENDINDCTQITIEMYNKRPLIIKFKESISRLLSPLL
ncbi:cardiolipin synthase [Tepidibacter hydrothermalis]|uniref:Cardiolipin synthase n=1 Tax=Tepidibacter hydrothermalis TaxID=3036126 RepID=A0ABY8EIS6_9FIRM|nr:cardiolipin synthase [Tepidibacter hydrothermalis]WFD11629.1 cardiolipin synthase [Tepidibacter hydrothermalis]